MQAFAVAGYLVFAPNGYAAKGPRPPSDAPQMLTLNKVDSKRRVPALGERKGSQGRALGWSA